MAKKPANVAASAKQRLLNLAREQGRLFDEVLVNYGLERLLYRLSISSYKDAFVLKGGMLVSLWADNPKRVTRDADFLGYDQDDAASVGQIFSDIMALHVKDGLEYGADQISVHAIRDAQQYGGFRLKTVAYLEKTRIPIVLDVGFGDVTTGPHYQIDYPSLLDMPRARIRAYAPHTVMAEKFHALDVLGMANSRMKDYYDLWVIWQTQAIDQAQLVEAIAATFERRGTLVPTVLPIGLTDAFSQDADKSRQWEAYADSIELSSLALDDVERALAARFEPICENLAEKEPDRSSTP